MDSRAVESSSNFPWIVTAVVSIAALYYGRTVLVPIVVAMVLTILLSPLATQLEKWHLGRRLPALLVWIAAVVVILLVGWLVVHQAVNLAAELPAYSATISKKIESIRGARKSGLGKAASTITSLGRELSNAIQASAGEQPNRSATNEAGASQQTKPVPVRVVGQQSGFTFQALKSAVGPILVPLLKAVMVFVVTAFMLFRREDIQERLFTLAGLSRIHVTKQVFAEATDRVVRYLWLLSTVNFSLGALFGTSLYFLGVPNAFLWGVLTGLLRFVPYIGSTIGAAMPIFLSFAIFGSWTKPLIALGVFLCLEGVTAYAVEPVLYARRTGVSSLAILIAAIFWAALWGPVGLLLSVPLTVCIVAVGRYIPELEFLSILFGDQAGIPNDVQLYQALAAGRVEEAQQLVDEYLKEKPIQMLYDSVFMPVLVLTEQDKVSGWQETQRCDRLFGALRAIIEELTIRYTRSIGIATHPEITSSETLPYRHSETPTARVACIPIRDEGDEIACLMLGHLLKIAGYNSHEIALGTQREMLDELGEHEANIVCLSALPPFGISSIRRLYKRLRIRFPHCSVGICLWRFRSDAEAMSSLLELAESGLILTSFADATVRIQQFVDSSESETRSIGKRPG